jgi:hypothetical protein
MKNSLNAEDYPYMDTVLFFDEANTTEAIGVIKEIMCDKSLGGKPIKLHERLKIVADVQLEAQWAEPVSLTFHSVLRKLYTEPSIDASMLPTKLLFIWLLGFRERRFFRNQPIR